MISSAPSSTTTSASAEPRSLYATKVYGYVTVPYRIVFDAPGIGKWLQQCWPLLWQTWSDITDISRISVATRRKILLYRFEHRRTTMWMPGRWRAVRWWLGRLMARDHWAWDVEFVARHTTDEPHGHSLDALRRPLREFLFPEGLVNLFNHYDSLLNVEDGYIYIPPTTAYHIRLKSLQPPGHPGWIGYGGESQREYLAHAHEPHSEALRRSAASQTGAASAGSVPVTWRDVRLHQFRFGDGFISLGFELCAAQCDRNAGGLPGALARLRAWSQRPELMELGFAPKRPRLPGDILSAPLPWQPPPAMGLGTLMRHLLTPSELDAEEPELKQWAFLWDEPPTTLRNSHRIEFPLAKQVPLLLLPLGDTATATSTDTSAATSTDTSAAESATPGAVVEPLVEGVHVCAEVLAEDALPYFAAAPAAEAAVASDTDERNAGASENEASDVELEPPVESEAAASTEERLQETSRAHALSVFLLALLRRVKLAQIGDLLAMPRGRSGLNTAPELQMVAFELSVARDRFLAGAPALGGRLARLWAHMEREWRSLELEERLTTIVDSYSDNYFRRRSLRLIARVTSTFWFFFRWVILTLIIAQFVVIAVTGALLGVVAVLTLSVFITLILFCVWLTRRIFRDSDEPLHEESAPRAPPESRSKRFWRKWWIAVVALAEVVVLSVLLVLWPELREMMLPYLRNFAIALGIVLAVFFVVPLVLFAVSPRMRKAEMRKRFLSWLKREAFPVLGLGFVALVLFALVVWLVTFFGRVGLDEMRFPRFWGDVVEAPAEPGEEP